MWGQIGQILAKFFICIFIDHEEVESEKEQG